MDDNLAFLDRLQGRWELTGKMGEVPLHQQVRAEWTLGGTFLRMYFASLTGEDNPTSDYEAVYHIAFNGSHGVYVMHLLDTTDVPLHCVMGTGRRDRNSIPFLFEYGQTKFFNRLSWNPKADSWSFLQTYDEGGDVQTFATKEMIRVPD